MKRYISFFEDGLTLGLILGLTSLIGIFLGKEYERLTMPLTGVQVAVIAVMAVNMGWENGKDLDRGILTGTFIGTAFIAMGFSYFSRKVALFFVITSTSFSLVFTGLYATSAGFKIAISIYAYPAFLLGVWIIIIISSYLSESLREFYAYSLYTAIVFPFYLFLAIGVYFGIGFDIFQYSAYKSWGYHPATPLSAWLLLAGQLLLTAAMLYVRLCLYPQRKLRMSSLRSIRGDSDNTHLKKIMTSGKEGEMEGANFFFDEDGHNRHSWRNCSKKITLDI